SNPWQDDPPDRARHVGRHEDLRHHHGAELRAEDRRRPAAADPEGSARHRSLSRDRGLAMLRVTDMHVGYGAIRALRGVSLEVSEGEVVALIGANGAGKSTLLRTISGMLRPSSGDVLFEGRSLRGLPEDRIVRLGILQVQESRGILTRMTVQENLEMGAYGR